MAKARVLLLVLALSGIFGCDDPPSIPLGDLGTQAVATACDVGVRCGNYPDKASCTASTMAGLGQLVADVNAGRVTYDGKAAADCLAAFGSSTGLGSCSLTNALSASRPQACVDTFKGAVANGGACFDSFECKSGNCDNSSCAGVAGCCFGSCIAATTPPPAAVGAPCAPLFSQSCVDGAFCQADATGTSGTCAAKLAAGQPCVNLTDCAPGSVCVQGVTAASTTCGKLPAEGAPCSETGLCDGENDYCDVATMLCVRKVAPGGACPSQTECVGYASCDPTTLTCVASGGVGDACASPTPACIGSLQCSTAGVCAASAPPAVCL